MTGAPHTRRAALLAAAFLSPLGAHHALLASSTDTPSSPQAGSAPIADGRTFANVRLTTDAQPGGARFAARVANVWDDARTRRLLLTGDVRLALAGRSLVADRAVVWIERPPPGAPAATGAADNAPAQVAIFAENLRDPASSPDRAVRADRLLITAVVTGEISLRADLVRRERPADAFLAAAEDRLARYLADILRPPATSAARPVRSRPPPWAIRVPPPSDAAPPAPISQSDRLALATPVRPREPVLPLPAITPSTPEPSAAPAAAEPPPEPLPATVSPQDQSLGPADTVTPVPPGAGVVSFFSPTREFISGVAGGESAVILSDGVALQYAEISTGRTLQLTAESAVVFLARPGLRELADASRGLSADDVVGVYLEGHVVMTDGRYSIRAPRVYADIRRRRAIFLDAVFWAYDTLRGSPIYVRAESIRAESENQFQARNVRVSNSAFFEPALALGASSVTITRTPAAPDGPAQARDNFFVDAEGGTLLLAGSPVAPLPRYRGDISESFPLQSVTVGARDGKTLVRTRWDAINLLGLDPIAGFTADLLADGYFGRGPAFGLDTNWDTPALRGSLFGYWFYDNGRDRLSSGARIDHDNEHRSMLLADNLLRLDDNWDLFTEVSYVSDPAFVDSLFRSLAKERREFASSVYLRRRDEASVLSLEARGRFNDFTPNEYLLQSQGYQVERLPEGRYSRVADPLFGGAVYWTQDTSASRVALRFNKPPVREFGFDTPELSQEAFGVNPNQSLADRLAAEGLTGDAALRFDTRHELEAPLRFGAFTLTPFAVGRFTAYDQSFDTFAGRDEDAHRFYGLGGARLGTSLEHVDPSFQSSLFDLNRIRHVVEPSATFFYAGTTRDSATLPVFDRNVESLATGPAVRAGVTNTWQTYRGARGEEYIVDWATLRTDYVHGFRTSEFNSPIGRWIEARPELSNIGRYAETQGTLQLTDALALSTRNVVDARSGRLTYIAGGASIDHGEGLTTFADVRHIEPRDTLKTDFGVRYALSRQYAASAVVTVDFQRSQLESVFVQLERRFEQFALTFTFTRDDISRETGFGVTFRPTGLGEQSRRRLLSPFGFSDVERVGLTPVGTGDLKPFRTTQTDWQR